MRLPLTMRASGLSTAPPVASAVVRSRPALPATRRRRTSSSPSSTWALQPASTTRSCSRRPILQLRLRPNRPAAACGGSRESVHSRGLAPTPAGCPHEDQRHQRLEDVMYAVVVFFEAKPGHTAALRYALLTQSRNSLEREPSCRQFDVAEDPVDANAFLLYEVYGDEAAFKAHLETVHLKAFNETVAPLTESKRVLTYELISGHGQA